MDVSTSTLDQDTFDSLSRLVFPSDIPQVALDLDLGHWLKQGFSLTKGFPGILQPKNGPCGLLAAVHALLVKDLIFDTKTWTDPQQPLTDDLVLQSLARVLGSMLEKAATEGAGKIIVVTKLPSAPVSLMNCENLLVHTVVNKKVAQDVIGANIQQFVNEEGAVLLLYALVLSKGIGNLAQELQLSNGKWGDCTLIVGPNGLCAQSMVSLAVFGKALPDITDEVFALYKGNIDIGLLTYEEVENVTFGSGFAIISDRLKHPEFPIWIVHGGDHYTTLFGFSKEILGCGIPKKSGLDSGKCANGCGFYATQEFYGYCSSCYKKVGEKKQQQQQQSQAQSQAPQKCKKNGCDFFGNEKCFGYCSVDWKALPAAEQAKIQQDDNNAKQAQKQQQQQSGSPVLATYNFMIYHFNGLPPAGPHLAPIKVVKHSGSQEISNPNALKNVAMVVQRKWVSNNPQDENSGWWEFEVSLKFSDDEKKQIQSGLLAPTPATMLYSSAFVVPQDQQWRCCECVLNQVFSRNPAGLEICMSCGQNVKQTGHTVWVQYEHLNGLLRREVDSRYSPKLVSLMHTRWPFSEMDFCGKKPPTI